LRAAAERLALLRVRATRCAWRESARCDAARRGIFFKAFNAARARVLRPSPLARRAVVRLPALRLAAVRRDDVLRLEPGRRLAVERLPAVLRVRLLVERRVPVLRVAVPRAEVVRPDELRLAALRRDGLERRVDDDLRADVEREPEPRLALREARLPDDFDLRDLPVERFGFSPMSTPARRASDNPIAIAWRAFFAPCLPLRIWSISRFTNSPACVLADLPARLSSMARRMVCLSGMGHPGSGSKDSRPCNPHAGFGNGANEAR
jgi:hypothetical protein